MTSNVQKVSTFLKIVYNLGIVSWSKFEVISMNLPEIIEIFTILLYIGYIGYFDGWFENVTNILLTILAMTMKIGKNASKGWKLKMV